MCCNQLQLLKCLSSHASFIECSGVGSGLLVLYCPKTSKSVRNYLKAEVTANFTSEFYNV